MTPAFSWLTVFLGSTSLAAFLIWLFHRKGSGLGLILLLLGVLQPVQNFWAAFLLVNLGRGVWVSPGSMVLFPANLLLALFLLLNQSDSRNFDELRKLVWRVNLFLFVLLIIGCILVAAGAASPITATQYFSISLLAVWGAVCFRADLFVLKWLFNRLFRQVPRASDRKDHRLKAALLGSGIFLSLLVATSVFDGLAFSGFARWATGSIAPLWLYVGMHSSAKLLSGGVFALALSAYYAFWAYSELEFLLYFRAESAASEVPSETVGHFPEPADWEQGPGETVGDWGADYETDPCPTPAPADVAAPESMLLASSYYFEQDLPGLLRRQANRGLWAAYFDGRLLGIRSRQKDLYRLADRLKIPRDALLVRWVHEDAVSTRS